MDAAQSQKFLDRLARIEERQKVTQREVVEICTTLNGSDGTGGMMGEIFKRLRRLEFYLAMAIGGGTVLYWVMKDSIIPK